MPKDELQQLWQEQSRDVAPRALEEVRRRAQKLDRQIRKRNWGEYVGGALVIVFFGWLGWTSLAAADRIASALMIAGMVYVMWHLGRHGSVRTLPEEYGVRDAYSFHLAELTRQRDLLAGVMRWYIAPMVPGWVAVALTKARPGHWLASGFIVVLFSAVAVWVRRINQRAVVCLDRQIEELRAWEVRS
jgi:hypothetical protein